MLPAVTEIRYEQQVGSPLSRVPRMHKFIQEINFSSRIDRDDLAGCCAAYLQKLMGDKFHIQQKDNRYIFNNKLMQKLENLNRLFVKHGDELTPITPGHVYVGGASFDIEIYENRCSFLSANSITCDKLEVIAKELDNKHLPSFIRQHMFPGIFSDNFVPGFIMTLPGGHFALKKFCEQRYKDYMSLPMIIENTGSYYFEASGQPTLLLGGSAYTCLSGKNSDHEARLRATIKTGYADGIVQAILKEPKGDFIEYWYVDAVKGEEFDHYSLKDMIMEGFCSRHTALLDKVSRAYSKEYFMKMRKQDDETWKSAIMEFLDDNGPSTLSDIAHGVHIGELAVLKYINKIQDIKKGNNRYFLP